MVAGGKPDFVNFKTYGNRANVAEKYAAEELVSVALVSFVAILVSSAATPGATAPPGSVTVPTTAPVAAVCAAALTHPINNPRSTTKNAKNRADFPIRTSPLQ